jgi:hypothetical protein
MMMMRWWVSLFLTVYNSKVEKRTSKQERGLARPLNYSVRVGSRRFGSRRRSTRAHVLNRGGVRHRAALYVSGVVNSIG